MVLDLPLVKIKGFLPSTPVGSASPPVISSSSVTTGSSKSVEAKDAPYAPPALEKIQVLLGSSVSEISPTVPKKIAMALEVPASSFPNNSSPTQKTIDDASTPARLGTSTAAETSQPPRESPWATKFKNSLHNLKHMNPPSFLEDGTLVILNPPFVLLKTAEMWKRHLVAQFHGLCPHLPRVFSNLNPIWGRYGNITIPIITETTAMIFIPFSTTRQWVADIGFWQAGNCVCMVYPWSSEGPLVLEELSTAPTSTVLKRIPPRLYSLEGFSVIASGIGKPLQTKKS
ncbi:uncharacterized protein LOC111829548 [Capsella rubella]|uniref:uncharacterized protein LOC111829548 n=1 Tax=Capsella rubella TaxID=81985 RepID=UPI000CD4C75D|nr:uncharacterized protein LOC111829548 [Capsella rubella]